MEREELERLARLEEQHKQMVQQHGEMKLALEQNTQLTGQVASDTKELIDIFRTVKTGTKLIIFVFGVLKWLGGIVVAALGVWYAIKHHGAPPPSLPNILGDDHG